MSARVAFLIVSHRAPEQVLRLVRALREHPGAEVLVRHDQRRSRLDEGELERAGGRLHPDDLAVEWGSCWVSTDWPILGRRALQAVLRAAGERRALMRHYRRSIVPSESFFATVLMNDPDMRVSHDDRRFASFAPGSAHPDVLTSADLDRLRAAGAHFARKFDAEVDATVLDRLDELRRPAGPR